MSIKTTIVSLIASVLILGGAFYYYRENGNQSKNPAPLKKSEAAAIEGKGLREFASNTDTKDSGVSPKDKAMFQEVLDDLKISGDGKDKSQDQKAIDALSTTIKNTHLFLKHIFQGRLSRSWLEAGIIPSQLLPT